MIQGAAGLQPDSLLGVLVVQEQPILVRVAKALDLRETITDLGAGIEHGGLKVEYVKQKVQNSADLQVK